MIRIAVFLILCILSWQDYRYKQVHGLLLLLAVGNVLLNNILIRQQELTEILFQASMGIWLLMISKLWKEHIGAADGWVCVLTGFVLGGFKNIQMMMFAFLLAAVFGLFGVFVLQKNKTEHMAFIPFITIAYGLVSVIEMIGVEKWS
jgi:prepilin signal peptidase PulO-like enzyme (type II secretory pathway)